MKRMSLLVIRTYFGFDNAFQFTRSLDKVSRAIDPTSVPLSEATSADNSISKEFSTGCHQRNFSMVVVTILLRLSTFRVGTPVSGRMLSSRPQMYILVLSDFFLRLPSPCLNLRLPTYDVKMIQFEMMDQIF